MEPSSDDVNPIDSDDEVEHVGSVLVDTFEDENDQWELQQSIDDYISQARKNEALQQKNEVAPQHVAQNAENTVQPPKDNDNVAQPPPKAAENAEPQPGAKPPQETEEEPGINMVLVGVGAAIAVAAVGIGIWAVVRKRGKH